MTHFRPICLMPLSVSNNADRIVSVPPRRQRNVKKDLTLKRYRYKPVKNCRRFLLTSKRRRSAFVIFQAIKPLFSAGKLLAGAKATISQPLLASSDTQSQDESPDSSGMVDDQNASPDEDDSRNGMAVATSTVTASAAVTMTAAAAAVAPTTTNGRSQKAKCVRNRKTSKCCDSMKQMTRSNREKMLQEKEDFQLAKMLQECIGTSDTASRYSLRSRNKSSVSSLSSTSSTQDLFHNKGISIAAAAAMPKFNKKDTTMTPATATTASRSQRNTNDSNDKFIDFSFQKLTRSRRIAMTMSGV